MNVLGVVQVHKPFEVQALVAQWQMENALLCPVIMHRPLSGFSRFWFLLTPRLVRLFICGYIDEVFQHELGRLSSSKVRVGKLLVLSSYEMEALEAVCRSVPLSKC
jgi:hypothetical protein